MNKHKIQKTESNQIQVYPLITTQIIMFLMSLATVLVYFYLHSMGITVIFFILMYFFYYKIQVLLSKNLVVEITDDKMFFVLDGKRIVLKSLKIYEYRFPRVMENIVRFNNSIVMVTVKKANIMGEPTEKEKMLLKQCIETIKTHNKVDRRITLDLTPILFMFGTHTIVYLALISIVLFILFAIYFIEVSKYFHTFAY